MTEALWSGQYSLAEVLDGLLLSDAFVSRHNWQHGSYFAMSQVQWRLSWLRLLKELFEARGFTASIRPRPLTNSNVLYIGVNQLFNLARDRYYPDGVKAVPRDLKLTPISTLLWYLGDGNLAYSRNSPQVTLGGCSFSITDLGRLGSEVYKITQVETSITRQVRGDRVYPVLRLVGGRKSLEKFFTVTFIPEFTPKVFYYKFRGFRYG